MTLHPGSASGVPHFSSVRARASSSAKSLAGRSGDFFQAAGQKLFAHLRVVAVPAELHAEFRGGASVGGVHEFDVLHVLAGGAVDDGGDAFGYVVMRRETELVEGGEEVVVARLVPGAPVAHRPGVDDLVVEDVVVIGAADAGLGRVVFAGIAGSAEQLRGGAVDAEIVGRSEVEQVFGVDCAVEMIVQVSALGHVVQEGKQQWRLVADRVEIARGFLLGGLRRGEDSKNDEDRITAQGFQDHWRSLKNQEGHCNSGEWSTPIAAEVSNSKPSPQRTRSITKVVACRRFLCETLCPSGLRS